MQILRQEKKADDTPLHSAARFGNADTVTDLLKAGANIEAKDKNGETPLHSAVISNNAETVTALLNAGADIESRDNDGATPLHVGPPHLAMLMASLPC